MVKRRSLHLVLAEQRRIGCHGSAVGQRPDARKPFVHRVPGPEILPLKGDIALPAIAELGEEDVDFVPLRTFAEHQVVALRPAELVDQPGGRGPLRIAQHPGVQRRQDALEQILPIHVNASPARCGRSFAGPPRNSLHVRRRCPCMPDVAGSPHARTALGVAAVSVPSVLALESWVNPLDGSERDPAPLEAFRDGRRSDRLPPKPGEDDSRVLPQPGQWHIYHSSMIYQIKFDETTEIGACTPLGIVARIPLA